MITLRPRSLSGLLSAALLLIVLPLTAAVVYGGVQMREMSRGSDALVRDSVELTQQTQVLFQNIAAMERSASLYVVLEDPRLAAAFDANLGAFNRTLDSLADHAPVAQLERVRAAGRAAAGVALGAVAGDRTASLVARFDVLGIEASVLADQTRKGIDTRLLEVERRAQATQQWLLWAIMALVPASLALAAIFALFVLRPLRALDRAIDDLGRGAVSQPISIPGPVDLSALGRQLEWLRTRLLEIAVERNRFLRHMSHELKTPLANIREGTDLLLDGAVGPLDVNQLEVASILRENALRLQQLIENLLSYSAWQSSASTVELSSFRLDSLIGTVVDSQRLALAARNVTLDLQVDDVDLVADRTKLKLVLDNLLSNALKFTPGGGRIHLHAFQAGRSTVIDLADTGPGIPPEERDKVFQAFYSGAAPQGGPLKGTGIGLSVVREFVQAHGGTIEIVDGQFPGAHMRIRLPNAGLKESANAA
ncbi:MAG TPA: ATP-binding protein [Steroidobacteraceae bacterium]|nr:ATP-binding protein [Steroidobacteraceae bacterium]